MFLHAKRQSDSNINYIFIINLEYIFFSHIIPHLALFFMHARRLFSTFFARSLFSHIRRREDAFWCIRRTSAARISHARRSIFISIITRTLNVTAITTKLIESSSMKKPWRSMREQMTMTMMVEVKMENSTEVNIVAVKERMESSGMRAHIRRSISFSWVVAWSYLYFSLHSYIYFLTILSFHEGCIESGSLYASGESL